ncbi:nucleobindin-2 [Eurytemora carolleeae]|uniref:nucleobindin-2 n=1 Tax=Eurytemora carolleeae TaxID=1294199 RepID=UPI000C7782A6|nr:nucleobindin-2 [Eurytemora carolleeae]|eukprot:XP_023341307.1 nucleobindin-2-like [Eurytemora affinis]
MFECLNTFSTIISCSTMAGWTRVTRNTYFILILIMIKMVSLTATDTGSTKEKDVIENDDSMNHLPEATFQKYAHRVFYILEKTEWKNISHNWWRKRNDPQSELTENEINELVTLLDGLLEKDSSNLTQKELNYVKKREIDQIRRRILPRKKYLQKDFQEPDHLDMTRIKFDGQDWKLLIRAFEKHRREWTHLRELNWKQFQMEKLFQEKQVLRHMKNDVERKKEIERIEKHKAELSNIELKHPLTKNQVEEVWEEKDNLPKEEFNERTFFALHDLDSNGFLDEHEVNLILLVIHLLMGLFTHSIIGMFYLHIYTFTHLHIYAFVNLIIY